MTMKVQTVNGSRGNTAEPPRSTAYYYADLEKIKRKNQENHCPQHQDVQNEELSEYVESNEVVNDGPVVEVPPFRDRVRQRSLPEYNTPENCRKVPEETYSTAGTFPMPEPKEKEPLLAELEIVGRLPLTQLDSSSGVRRSRSWYLCCPNVGEEEMSRESSWRYSSLRTVTAPPVPGQNGMHVMVATQSSGRDDLAALRAERDALARALAAERQRAATAARAHDARLAELHGVIAELVRRRAHDKHAGAIPEEEVSDECESTTQPAGELDNDADRSRTEQNDSSSLASPEELPTPQEPKVEPVDDTTDTSAHEHHSRADNPRLEVTPAQSGHVTDNCDTSLNLSERDSEICLSTARCCQYARQVHGSVDSCDRQNGSAESRLYTPSAERCESRQAKVASRVRLRKTEETVSNNHLTNEESWCADAAEKLALDVCAQADLREALAAASNDESRATASACVLRARCARLQADCRVLRCALDRATDTAHRMSVWSAAQESSCVALCEALRAADRALEVYDVLLALAETAHAHTPHEQRATAECVGRRLLARLEAELASARVQVGDPLLSPGPWLQNDHQSIAEPPWEAECEVRLRAHAARLKAETVTLRDEHPPPHFFSYYDVEEEDIGKATGSFSMAEMEAAVAMQEVFEARERRALTRLAQASDPASLVDTQLEGTRGRRRRERHWLDPHASETDL